MTQIIRHSVMLFDGFLRMVSVASGCSSKMPYMGRLLKANVFLTALVAVSVGSRCQEMRCQGGPSFLLLDGAFLVS